MQSRYREGLEALSTAIAALEKHSGEAHAELVLARLLDYQGWLFLRVGQLGPARQVLEASRACFQRNGDQIPATFGGDPRTALGVLAIIAGDYAEANRLGSEALAASQARGDIWNEMFATYVLANAAVARGEYPAAQQMAEQGHGIAVAHGEEWFRAYLLNDLGDIAMAQANYALAEKYFQSSYDIRQAFGDSEGMGIALNHLAETALRQGEPGLAREQYQRSLALYQELGDRGGLAAVRHGLGRTALADQQLDEARAHLAEAIRLASEANFVPLILAVIVTAGQWLLASGQPKQAISWIEFAGQHPASEPDTRARARPLLDSASPAPDLIHSTQQPDLKDIVDALQARLAIPAGQPRTAPAPQLGEIFAPRELEVLHLVAEGHSNKQIAAALHLGLGTVKWYTGQIYAKLQVSSRAQAIKQARQLGLLR
jgi:ATP/maltotriose-dependent transcriptional regulator MalT